MSSQPFRQTSQASSVTDGMTYKPSFSTVPRELRLNIFTHTLPQRILQLGITNGAPFPNLFFKPLQGEAFEVYPEYVGPIRTTLPVTFHINYESRALCLSLYIPF